MSFKGQNEDVPSDTKRIIETPPPPGALLFTLIQYMIFKSRSDLKAGLESKSGYMGTAEYAVIS